MVKVSYEQKPYRRSMMEAWGASVVASPSEDTNSGRAILAADPASPGSLGIAISEAVEDAAQREDTAYSLGSVLNHVLMHQTVIGQEALAQMELAGVVPRPRRRLRRRRLQLRRARVPVPAREDRRARDRRARLRAGRLPDADARALRLRLRGHEPADAARPHAHARPRLRPARDPRGRPPLPRRGAADLAARPRRARPRRGLRPDGRLRLGGAASPAPRGSSRRRSRRTRSTASSRRRPPRTRRAASARSSSTSPATATSTSAPTTPTSTASSRTSSSPRTRSPGRSQAIEPLPKPAGVA